ncbi:MAG: hypothetical protein DDG59_02750, partial [Anaerolineae bacterium]
MDEIRLKGKRLLILYTVVLIVAFSPLKPLGQLLPLLVIVWVSIVAKIKIRYHLSLYGIFLFIAVFAGLFYLSIVPHFTLVNFLMSLLTFSYLSVLYFDFSNVVNQRFLISVRNITLIILLFQSGYGILQALVGFFRDRSFDNSVGDIVRGTIEPSFHASGLGGNVMFAIQLSTLLILVISTKKKIFSKQFLFMLGVICMAWIVASALHTILFALISILLTSFVFRVRIGNRIIRSNLRKLSFGFFITLAVLGSIFIPRNLMTLPYHLSLFWGESDMLGNEKVLATIVAIRELPKEFSLSPLIGVGPGHFSSRAALILSGEFLRGSRFPIVSKSYYTEKYILPLFTQYISQYDCGSTCLPYYSWLTIFGELGMVGILALLAFISSIKNLVQQAKIEEFPYMKWGLSVFVIYFILLGFQENYWEYTQSMTPPF